MTDFINHPLVRGDVKRMHALTLLRATNPWPSARELARVIEWSKTTAAEFLNAVRAFDSQVSGQVSGSVRTPPDFEIKSDTLPDSVRTENGNETNDTALSGQVSGHPKTGQLPNSQKLPHPINKLPSSVSDSESLTPFDIPESPTGALRRAEQPRLDFNHAEEHRADLLKALIFDHGIRLLTADGSSEANARSFLGMRIGQIGREPLAMAVARAVIEQVVDPKAYLAACTREGIRRRQSDAGDDDQPKRDPWDFGDDDTDGGAHGPH